MHVKKAVFIFVTLIACLFTSCFLEVTPDSYTVTFNYNYMEPGKTTNTESVYVVIEGSAAPSMFVQREGYTLVGWFYDRECTSPFDFSTAIRSNIVLYAKWLKNCTVLFDYNYTNGPAAYETTVVEGKTVQEYPATRVGYALAGWYTSPEPTLQNDSSKVYFPSTITNDVVYYAKWADAIKITYNYNDGAIPTTEDRYVQRNTSPENITPTRSGYTFIGWYSSPTEQSDDFKINFTDRVLEDKVFYAKWLRNWKVTFNYNCTDAPTPYVVEVANNATVNSYAATIDNYALVGWYTTKDTVGGTEVDFDQPITDDVVYYAKWTSDYIKVTYDYKYGQTTEDRYIARNTSAENYTPIRSGYIFDGWYEDSALQTSANFNVQLIANKTYYAKWLKNCKVTFNYNFQGSPSSYVTYVVQGKKASSYPATRTSYALDGWYTEEGCSNKVDFDTTIINDDIEFYAKWTTDVIKVTYNYNDGSNPTTEDRYILQGTTADNITPVLAGYVFDGWYEEPEKVNEAVFTPLLSNKTYYAKWLKNCKITFSYNYSGSSTVYEQYVVEGNKVTSFPASRNGYALDGWFTDSGTSEGNEVDFSLTVTDDKIFYAKWTENVVTVVYNYNYGNNPITEERYVVKNTSAESITPTRNGYVFDGWYTQSSSENQTVENKADFSVKLTSNKTYFAKWLKKCKVTFNYNYPGSPVAYETYVVQGEKVGSYPASRANYGLDGWYTTSVAAQQTASTKVDFGSTIINSDVTYYAKWSSSVVAVTYDFNDGSTPEVRYIASGTSADNFTPVREGFKFEGWYNEVGTTTEASFGVLTTPKTYYAKWTPIWIVKFNYNYTNCPAAYEVKVNDGQTVSSYQASQSGYVLVGWYTNKNTTEGSEVNFSTEIHQNKEYFAKWVSTDVKITYDYCYDQITLDKYIMTGSKAENFTPNRTGYSFGGWYTTSGLNTPVNFNNSVSTSTTYYAKWIPIQYSISYLDQGGVSACSGTSWNMEKATIHTYGTVTTLAKPEKLGYTFEGWFIDIGCTTSVVEVLGATDYTSNITLYAKWVGKQYTVTFVNNTEGATTPSPQTKKVTYGSAYGNLASTKLENWEFDWYDASSGGTLIDASTIVNKAYDHTLYARGLQTVLKITYNCKDDDTNPTMMYRYIGRNTSAISLTPERAGYVFNGWYINETSTKVNFESQQLTQDQNYYAKWLKNCKVTFNSGSGSYSTYVVEGNTTETFETTKTGYTLEGWYTSSTQQDNTTKVSFPVTISQDITYYAKWTPLQYTVSFDKNGGSDLSNDSITETFASNYSLPTVTAPTGYSFKGWYTALVGGSKVTSSTIVGISAENQTLYAQWTANTYTVTFDKNDTKASAVSKASMEVSYGSTYGGLATTSKKDWYFEWYDAPTGGNKITESTVVTATQNHTLYAHWTQDVLTITYNCLDKETNPTIKVRYIARNTSAEEIIPKKKGYEFVGWYTDEATSDGKEVDFEQRLTQNVTYYAKWTPCVYTITYKDQGNISLSATSWETGTVLNTYSYSEDYGDNKPIIIKPIKIGYDFIGWYSDADCATSFTSSTTGNVTVYNIASNTTGSITLYAKWAPHVYNIKYYEQDGTEIPSNLWNTDDNHPTSHTYGSQTALVSLNNKTGYAFVGWYTDSSCSDDNKVTSLGKTDFTAENTTENSINLYAKWAPCFKINYYNGINQISSTINEALADDTQIPETSQIISNCPKIHTFGFETVLAVPVKEGYSFGGWFTDKSCQGAGLSSLGAITYNDTITLYAKWTPKKYNVTLNTMSATGKLISGNVNNIEEADCSRIVTYDAYYKKTSDGESPFITVVRTGYTFQGWYTTETSGGTMITSDDVVKITQDTTLYARWTANTYSITISENSGTGFAGSLMATYDSSIITKTGYDASKRSGYTLDGYYFNDSTKILNADGTLVSGTVEGFIKNGQWAYDGNISLFAYWKENTYYISYTNIDKIINGSDLPTSHTTGADFSLPNGKKEPGYECVWSNGNTLVNSKESFENSINYAPNGSTITLDGNWIYMTFSIDISKANLTDKSRGYLVQVGSTWGSILGYEGFTVYGYSIMFNGYYVAAENIVSLNDHIIAGGSYRLLN